MQTHDHHSDFRSLIKIKASRKSFKSKTKKKQKPKLNGNDDGDNDDDVSLKYV